MLGNVRFPGEAEVCGSEWLTTLRQAAVREDAYQKRGSLVASSAWQQQTKITINHLYTTCRTGKKPFEHLYSNFFRLIRNLKLTKASSNLYMYTSIISVDLETNFAGHFHTAFGWGKNLRLCERPVSVATCHLFLFWILQLLLSNILKRPATSCNSYSIA